MDPTQTRPITDADMEFLHRVYASTRQEELERVPWSQEQKVAFCRMQCVAQHTHYQKHYPSASYEIIEKGGTGIGRLYVDRTGDEMLILDITLLPEYRGKGLGTRFLTNLQREAAEHQRPLHIHVEIFNPALSLYRRLGFQKKSEEGVYFLMEWREGSPAPAVTA